jgi:Na+/phosphate symporter
MKERRTVHQVHQMGVAAGECLELLQKAFMKNSLEVLTTFQQRIATIKTEEKELAKQIRGLDQAERSHYGELCCHMIRIFDCLEDMGLALQKKITEKILFSDRAVTEISYISQESREMIKAASDLILVKNPVLVRYIQEAETMISRTTTEYATHHEERLIEGLCLPLGSPIYLKMLDCFKGIAREARKIATIFVD